MMKIAAASDDLNDLRCFLSMLYSPELDVDVTDVRVERGEEAHDHMFEADVEIGVQARMLLAHHMAANGHEFDFRKAAGRS